LGYIFKPEYVFLSSKTGFLLSYRVFGKYICTFTKIILMECFYFWFQIS